MVRSKYVVIGDVHGDYRALEKILMKVGIKRSGKDLTTWISQEHYIAILLGDLNDYKFSNPLYSSWITLCIGMQLETSGVGIVLHSNHHERLIQYLRCPGSVKLKNGLDKTVSELKFICPERVEHMGYWLSNRPLTYSFREKGVTYSCVHAYYPNSKQVSYTSPLYKDLCINGILDKAGKRIRWWEDSLYVDKERVVICGHYHMFVTTPSVVVIDGKCGSSNKGVLIAYIPSEERFLRVLSSTWNSSNKTYPSVKVCTYV